MLRQMKTYYWMLLCVGLMACNKKSHPSTPETVEQAIGMLATSVTSTRALISDTEVLQSEGFIVYGYKHTLAEGTQVFAHQPVNYNYGWTYAPTRYWDIAASYYFGAYSPQHLTAEHSGTDLEAHIVTLEAPYWQKIDGNETDIIVATSQDEANNYLTLNNGVVDLHFAHILSQLEVQFVRSPFLMNQYRLHAVGYRNVPIANGTATYRLNYTTPSQSAMNVISLSANPVAMLDNTDGIVVAETVQEVTTLKHMVVPFSTNNANGIEIVVEYSVNGIKRTATAITKFQTLEPEKRYTLRLTFDSGAEIKPEIYINEWNDEEVDEDDKYNW